MTETKQFNPYYYNQGNVNWYWYLVGKAIREMHYFFEKYDKQVKNKYYLKLIAFKDGYLKPFYQNKLKPLFLWVKNTKVVIRINHFLWKVFYFLKRKVHIIREFYVKLKIWLLTYKFKIRVPKRLRSKGHNVYKRNTPFKLMLILSGT